jgi:uncharacterized membrane protein YraQ (UPF0718 family)
MFVWIEFLVDKLVYGLFNLSEGTRTASAVHFFIYDVAKIFLLLFVIITAVAIIRSFLPPEKVRRWLSRKRQYAGNGLAAGIGILTPFCSCSAIPMTMGMLESGVPLGVTFSFLVSSPMVNEVALVLLLGLYGVGIAGVYVGTGVMIAVVAGIVIGKLKLENQLAIALPDGGVATLDAVKPSWSERLLNALDYTRDILKRIWPYVLVGIGIGAVIHGWVPQDFLLRFAGTNNPFAVPIAVVLAIPLYSNAAGVIPIVQALTAKGLPMGTALAFMMGVVGISLPELIILRKVMKTKLLAIFAGIMFVSITLVGYLFNALID